MTNIERDNKIPLSMLKLSFLDKIAFKGSYKGMRYILQKEEKIDDKNENNKEKEYILKVYTYKDLYNFENTKDKTEAIFSYDKDGINKALEYLDEKVKEYN